MYLLSLGKRLAMNGHKIIQVTSRIYNTRGTEVYKGIKIQRVYIPLKGKPEIGSYFFPLTSFSALKKLGEADIIQASGFRASMLTWLIGEILGKPTVLFIHQFFREYWGSMEINYLKRKIYPVVERYIANCPYNWFICPSKFSRETLIDAGVPRGKITVIYHGIEPIFHPKVNGKPKREKYKLNGKPVFGFTGRLSDASKGVTYLIKAAKHVTEEVRDAKLVLGGTGYREISPLIKKNGLEGKVVYVGKMPYHEVPMFYAMCDVVAGASLCEGFGFMYAEASRCSRPVVATKTGSIPEIILNGETGILVPPKNPEALAEAIIKVLTDGELARKMGEKGAEYTKRFTWENSVNQHLKLYEKLMGN